jgi:pimeloyl-ACP methyl ester carboxylesterase
MDGSGRGIGSARSGCECHGRHRVRIAVDEDLFLRLAGDGRYPLWLIHAYGDCGRSYMALFDRDPLREFTLIVPDLPGFGGSLPRRHHASLDGMADVLAALIERRVPSGPIGLVGHSLGSAVAVRAAQRIEGRVCAMFSIEGNLTESDGYFSGSADESEVPEEFQRRLAKLIWARATSRELRRYGGSVLSADAETLWWLSRDSKQAARGDALGAEYRSLACPSLYYWSAASTPEVTQDYLHEHCIRQEMYSGGHWPMLEDPDQTASAIGKFFREAFGLASDTDMGPTRSIQTQ